MVIEVQFKGRDMEFRGKTYDFELAPDVAVPEVGSIIRMEDLEGKAVCHRTRVLVTNIKDISDTPNIKKVIIIPSSMEEPSLSKR